MISTWHLLWIVPLSAWVGAFAVAFTTISRLKDYEASIDAELNARKRGDYNGE